MSIWTSLNDVGWKKPGPQPDPSLQGTCRHTDYPCSIAVPVDAMLKQVGKSYAYCPNCGHRYGDA